jgi:dTDP-4-amino-4,6-dideoxygalactose transaminase
MEIPFHKPYITEEEVAGVERALRSGWITMGPLTMEFEELFRDYIGAKNSVSVNSCTAGLHLALKTIGLMPGDEVLVPAITFTATAEVITYLGGVPVITDVEKETANIDVARLQEKITSRTRAIIPVHFAGQPCDMGELIDCAKRRKITVVEDAAHSLPASYRGRSIGTIGELTCFSFYATKTLTTGEGGMVTTECDEWAERMRSLRLHGISRDAWKRYSREGSWYYEVTEPGYKYNMTDVHAALGIAQLKKVDWMRERRAEIAAAYDAAFGASDLLTTPFVKHDRESAWHLYVIRLETEKLRAGRNDFIDALLRRGILASVHFIPLYRHPYYREALKASPEDYPVSEWLYERIVSLPIYPGMTDQEVGYVTETVLELLENSRR